MKKNYFRIRIIVVVRHPDVRIICVCIWSKNYAHRYAFRGRQLVEDCRRDRICRNIEPTWECRIPPPWYTYTYTYVPVPRFMYSTYILYGTGKRDLIRTVAYVRYII